MTVVKIKDDIHQMIEKIDKEEYLLDIHHSLSSLLDSGDILDVLNESQKLKLEKSIQQMNDGDVRPYQNFKEKYNQWFTK
jgi:methionyl-tRNA formyltransferase